MKQLKNGFILILLTFFFCVQKNTAQNKRNFLPHVTDRASGTRAVVSETDTDEKGIVYHYTSNQKYNLNVVYIIPTDYTPSVDFRARMSEIILRGQQYYGQQMAAHGYGYKTFGLLKDTTRNIIGMIVIKGKYPTSGYPYSNHSHAKEEVDHYFAAHPSRNHGEHTLVITPIGGPFYGTGKWCYAIDDGADFSINDSSNKYIGGMFHEMGHGFTLPHNSAKANEQALGTALMGAGNYTWGHVGQTTFLTDADCAVLNEIQVFNTDTVSYYRHAKVSLVRLHAVYDTTKEAIIISGKLSSSAKLTHVVYYADPNVNNEGEGVNRDYNALSWVSPVMNNDSFYIEMPLNAFAYKNDEIPYQMKIVPIVSKVGRAAEFDFHFDFRNELPVITFGTKNELSKNGWTAVVNSEQIADEPAPISNIIDGNNSTYWSSRWAPEPISPDLKLPFEINIDMRQTHHIGGFYIQNRPYALNNTPHEIQVQVSTDGQSWKEAKPQALFDKTSSLQYAYFNQPIDARYVKLIIKSVNYSGGDYSCSFAELGFFSPDN